MERTLPPAPLQTSGPANYGAGMDLRVLGHIEVAKDGRRLPLGGPKQRTVLALLIANAGRTVSTGSLIDGVYGDEPPQGVRRSIQTFVSNLRSELGDIIVGTNDGYELTVDRSDVDSMRFEDAVAATKDREPVEASQLLREALSLWHGHPYADVDGGHDLDAEIRRLDELRMQALEARIDADLAAGNHRELIAEIESLTVEYPLRERFTEQQMVALYRSGRQAEALRAYERTRTYLVNEMGLDPSPDLRDLERRILDQDATLDLEAASSIRRAAVMVTDIADPSSLSRISSEERSALIDEQTTAIDAAAEGHDGEIFANSGTAVYLLFPGASAAATAAGDIQRQLDGVEPEGHRLRIAIDVGDIESGETVSGPPVNRSAAIVAAGHGGQVLLSTAAQQEITETEGGGWIVKGLGSHELRGLDSPEIVHQLVIDGLPGRFPDLRTHAVPAALPTAARGLAGYELREEVGSGAFGVVHRAYQPSVGREVAIKVIRPEWANQPDFVRRFEIEAQLVARLEHPHIVPLYDYWREPDSAYLVMRWLRGGTLAHRIAKGTLTVDEAHNLLADVGPALSFAHRQGVVHRDIKASNVLLDEEGGAYLTDFGIAGDIAKPGAGSISDDVRSLAGLLRLCIGGTDETAVNRLLAKASSEQNGFADVRSFIAAWEEAVGVGTTTSEAVGYTPTRNPYKGLSAFGELDATDFHGREDLVNQLVAALVHNQLVVAVGPSGIGKSSAVKAGLIPALRNGAIEGSDRWLITTMVPGAFPFDELAAALIRVAVKAPPDLEDVLSKDSRGLSRAVARYLPPDGTVVLVIDQFEELFTLCENEDLRQSFLDTLVTAASDPHGRIKLIITIRADFFDRPLAYGEFGALIQEATVPVTSPTEAQLNAIVLAPAEGVGVSFENGLAERFVDAVKDQPGGLPLLEFSLTELFDQRDSDLITVAAYEASGGVKAALGRRAETTYQDLDPPHQELCRDIFLRMVTVNESGRDTRRRVRMSEIKRLGSNPRSVDEILLAFSRHRLITFDRDPITRGPTVEVAHEAILIEWPRLAGWIEDHREDLLLYSRLAAAVTDWENSDRSDPYLLTAGRLHQHETWTADTDLTLTSAEEEFLDTSRTAEDQRATQRRRIRRLVVSGFGIAALIGLVLATVALMARNESRDQAALAETSQAAAELKATEAETERANAQASETEAQTQAAIARAEGLAASSIAELGEDPERSVLLALESLREHDTSTGQAALHRAIEQHRTIWQSPTSQDCQTGSCFEGVAAHPDGNRIVVFDSTGRIYMVDTSIGPEPIWETQITGGEFVDISDPWFSGDELIIPASDVITNPVTESEIRGLFVLDAETGSTIDYVPLDGCFLYSYPPVPSDLTVNQPFIHSNISRSADDPSQCDLGAPWSDFIVRHGGVRSTNDVVLKVPESFDLLYFSPQVTSNGDFAVMATGAGGYLFDAWSGEVLDTYTANRIGLSSDGSLVAVGVDSAFVEIRDRATGAVRRTYGGAPSRLIFSRDNVFLLSPDFDGSTKIVDVASGTVTTELRGASTRPLDVSLAADETKVLISTVEDRRWWRLGFATQVPSRISETPAYDGDIHQAAVMRTANGILHMPELTDTAHGYRLIDTTSGDELRAASPVWRISKLSPDGSIVAEAQRLEHSVEAPSGQTVDLYGPIRLVDALSGELIVELATCPFFVAGHRNEEAEAGPNCEDETFFGAISDIEFSRDGSLVAIDSTNARPSVFDTTTGVLIWSTSEDSDGVRSIAISPDNAHVVYRRSWQDDFEIVVVDIDSAEEVATIEGCNPNTEILFSDDGGTLYAVDWCADTLVVDTSTWTTVKRSQQNQGGATHDMAINGTILATVATDDIVRAVDMENDNVLLEIQLPGPSSNLEWLDADHLFVTLEAGGAATFTINSAELQRIALSRVTRGFTAEECSTYAIDPCLTLEELKTG